MNAEDVLRLGYLVDYLVVYLMAIVIFSDSGFPLSNHRNPDKFSH